MRSEIDPDWVTLIEVCRQLRVSYSTLWGRVCNGSVDAEKRGSRWLIRRADLPRIAAALDLDELGGGDAAGRRSR